MAKHQAVKHVTSCGCSPLMGPDAKTAARFPRRSARRYVPAVKATAIAILTMVVSIYVQAGRECQQYYPIVSITGEPPPPPEIAAKVREDNEEWLQKVGFVLAFHKVYFSHTSENDMCIDSSIVRDKSIGKYEELARDEKWLAEHGYQK